MTAGEKWLEFFIALVRYQGIDAEEGELLSEGCDRWIARSPILARVVIVSAGTILTLHLANLISPKWDVMAKHFWGRFVN